MQPLPEIRAALDRLTEQSGGELDMASLLSSVAELAEAAVIEAKAQVAAAQGSIEKPLDQEGRH